MFPIYKSWVQIYFNFPIVLSRKVLNPQLLMTTIHGYQIISCFFPKNSDKVVTIARTIAKYINVTSVAFLLYTNSILYACNVLHLMTSPLSHAIPPKRSAPTWTPAAFISNFLPSGLSSSQSQS